MGRKRIEMAGRRFGRLLVIAYNGDRMWLCRCDCGSENSVHGGQLRQGTTFSCGCYKAEGDHGHAKNFARSPEYLAWQNMLGRCCRPTHKSYSYYGARGIRVCQEWLSFENFLKDMGPRPSKNHTLERINNNGNYEKVNCAWATKLEQANNKRTSKIVTVNGVSKTMAEWGRYFGVSYEQIKYVIRKTEKENGSQRL